MSGVMTVLMGTIAGYIGAAVYDDVNSDIPEDVTEDFWKNRRRVVVSNIVYTALVTIYLLFNGVDDSKLHSTIIVNLMLTTAVVIVSYIGGASIQDKYMKKLK